MGKILQHKVCVMTGISGSIGQAAVLRFAEEDSVLVSALKGWHSAMNQRLRLLQKHSSRLKHWLPDGAVSNQTKEL